MLTPRAGSSVKATLNFIADKSDGGRFSNYDENLADQNLQPALVEIRNARMLPTAPTLDHEGFTLVNAPVAAAEWSNASWRESVYLPFCVDLVSRLTGAKMACSIAGVYFRMEDRGERARAGAFPLAGFVHLDGSPQGAESHIETLVDKATRKRYPNQTIYNVWRALTLPPQGTPLALCDRRTVARDDMAVGYMLPVPGHAELRAEEEAPYLISVVSPDQRWYYFPDMTPDEALVFTSIDLIDRQHPGCLHTAFRHPDLTAAAPRVSLEARVVAFFE